MRKSGFLLLASMALALLLVSGVAWAGLMPAAYWEMDETEGQMIDSSGNGNNGTPMNVVQGGEEDVDGDGQVESTYFFNGSTTTPSRVDVPDADGLDPKANDITLTARVKVNGTSLDDDSYDVVRKGFITTEGGDYKMEIKRTADPSIGRLHCFFRGIQEDGNDDSVNRVARPDIVDGNWHTLECVKTSDSVEARVDGGSPFTTTGSADSIDNAANVLVGAKKVTRTKSGGERGDDVFDGWMDYVRIEIAPQPEVVAQPDPAQ